jgi:hypothetical protein
MVTLEGRQGVRVHSVRRGLRRFAEAEGLGDPPLLTEVIEAFCLQGLHGRTTSTQGTYRSVLRQLAAVAKPKAATPFAASPASLPYTTAERTELWSWCGSFRLPWRRNAGLVLLGLGIGAGLRPQEIVSVRGDDVIVTACGVCLVVAGPKPRTVAVRAPYASFLSGAGRGAGRAHLFHPGGADRSYHNFVNDFCRLVATPGAPRLSSLRCRSSFICDQLGSGRALETVLEESGIAEVESLLRYTRLVHGAPRSKALLRRRLKEEQDR